MTAVHREWKGMTYANQIEIDHYETLAGSHFYLVRRRYDTGNCGFNVNKKFDSLRLAYNDALEHQKTGKLKGCPIYFIPVGRRLFEGIVEYAYEEPVELTDETLVVQMILRYA